MPEGDSVFRLRHRLTPALAERTVVAGELRGGAAAGLPLSGARVLGLDTHGKHLLMRFDGGWTLHTHLRMQGSWSITRAGRSLPPRECHRVRVRLRMDTGATVWGIDLPVVDLVRTADESSLLRHLGPDPLRSDWDAGEAQARLGRDPARPFVAALRDQRNLAGLGNLWVNEIAFLTGTHPFAPVARPDLGRVVALAARALTLSATVPGMYQVTTGDRRRGRTHWVTGRAGQPCRRCGTTISVDAGVPHDPDLRRTWWCPLCQPEVVSHNPLSASGGSP